MKDARLAICIPTYNRSAMLEETLERSLEKYAQRGWDLYIYDSSIDDSTKIIVEKYVKEYPGLFYRYIDSSVHSNLKVYTILEHFGRSQEYEYIWVCTDSFTWSEKLLDTVKNNLDLNYDLLLVNYRDVERIGTKVFCDYNELFVNCAWHMTYYGATIYNVKTMLQEVPWEYLKARYCIPERINFSHVAFCFEKICTLPQFTAKHLSFHSDNLYVSPIKRYTSSWRNDAIYIYCVCWPSTIMALPECYHNKNLAIRKHGINSKMFLESNLILFREDGIYTYDVYKKYKEKWKDLTNLSNLKLKIIALLPAKWVWMLQFNYFYKSKRAEKRIVKFAAKYSHIYLYGCGRKVATYIQYLKKGNIYFNGFLVTSLQEGKTTYMNKDVKQFHMDILSDPDIGLILALGKKNAQEVMDMIKETGIKPKCGIYVE